MSGEWEHGLFGCFDNFGTCIITYFFPCYTFGKNAEGVGDSCCLCGLLYFIPPVNLFALASIRGKVRSQKGIHGSFIGDCCMHMFCHLCALVQESQELECPGGQCIARS